MKCCFSKKVCLCKNRPPIALQTPSDLLKNAFSRPSSAKASAANTFSDFSRKALWRNGFRRVRRPPSKAVQVRPFPNRSKNSKSSPGDRVRVRPPHRHQTQEIRTRFSRLETGSDFFFSSLTTSFPMGLLFAKNPNREDQGKRRRMIVEYNCFTDSL